MVAVRVLERVATQTLLGIRFWDPITNAQVMNGLSVKGQMLSQDRTRRVGRAVRGVRTRSGVYAIFGLHPDEYAAPDALLWETVPASRRVVVDVEDPLNRYQPVSFEVSIPFRGPFRGEGAWLGHALLLPEPVAGQAQGVYLWPAAARSVPPGLTALYANLVVGNADRPPPAAHAVVQVLRPGPTGNLVSHAYGLADAHGRVTLLMPYPTVPDPPIDTPYPPLGDQTFALTARVFYQPSAMNPLPGSAHPNLESVLQQALAQVGLTRTDTLTLGNELAITLPFGAPLVLRTQTSDPKRPEPYLRVQPA
jgi:hypothetical protein